MTCIGKIGSLTFGAKQVSLQVKDSSPQSHLLKDNAKTVDVALLCASWRKALHSQQLWSHPQLTYTQAYADAHRHRQGTDSEQQSL